MQIEQRIINETGDYRLTVIHDDGTRQRVRRGETIHAGTDPASVVTRADLVALLPSMTVIAYAPHAPNLDNVKADAVSQVDAWVDSKFAMGVDVVWDGQTYQMDTRAGQRAARNWSMFDAGIAKAAAGLASWQPLTVYSMDRRPITLTTLQEASSFQDALYAADRALLSAGGIAKAQIDAASDVASVQAVVDAL